MVSQRQQQEYRLQELGDFLRTRRARLTPVKKATERKKLSFLGEKEIFGWERGMLTAACVASKQVFRKQPLIF
jgi:hypothetical protein